MGSRRVRCPNRGTDPRLRAFAAGTRRPGPWTQADVWRCVGVDGKRVSSLSGFQGGAWRGGRVQWQIHVQSVRAARRVLRHAGRAYPQDLSQFLLPSSALAVHGLAAPERRLIERDIPYAIVEDLGRSSTSPLPRPNATRSEFARAVLDGFARRPRSLPCRFFYDARGSELFEEITKLEEYYPTRVETALLESFGDD